MLDRAGPSRWNLSLTMSVAHLPPTPKLSEARSPNLSPEMTASAHNLLEHHDMRELKGRLALSPFRPHRMQCYLNTTCCMRPCLGSRLATMYRMEPQCCGLPKNDALLAKIRFSPTKGSRHGPVSHLGTVQLLQRHTREARRVFKPRDRLRNCWVGGNTHIVRRFDQINGIPDILSPGYPGFNWARQNWVADPDVEGNEAGLLSTMETSRIFACFST